MCTRCLLFGRNTSNLLYHYLGIYVSTTRCALSLSLPPPPPPSIAAEFLAAATDQKNKKKGVGGSIIGFVLLEASCQLILEPNLPPMMFIIPWDAPRIYVRILILMFYVKSS